ncbi:hypothetical protein HXA31_03120 [Salipaludibacillus agaradhaerens]|jgi:hypothetical protein|uniref:Uncharacterized protein n=1 Tax=Salipaludibacillus agaradhaerens TaxID=76935 RepID=A0A9Q4FZ94_SALAG|nr:hypothetical protein [Salipaludibacillus agaradhaerens]MCR6097171.1 hypothetical protein [Salipaludibacillus agaradhaerens]MCR6113344.1 hypothetical protein [Salipaludibacillus agaradhaerens]
MGEVFEFEIIDLVIDKLRKQKDRIIEMDSRIVGHLKLYVPENQEPNTRIKQSFV